MKTSKLNNSLVIGSLLLGSVACSNKTELPKKPNIVIIYADDLGYGDVSCYGSVNLETPNVDKLAKEGVRFTNGYCTSATSTPSRYGLLTGEYPWRNKRAQILPGTAPLIIKPGTVTLPSMLQKNGYTTGIVGKWHLGLGNGNVDWNKEIKPGPRQVGFDYDYIMAATNDRVPTVYIEHGKVVNLDLNDPIEINYKKNFEGEPTGVLNPEMLKLKSSHGQGHNNSIVNGIGRIGFMKGGQKARWVDEKMAETFLNKAKSFVDRNSKKPFFLYYALNQPHVPRVPSAKFAGKSGLGARGDVILEADWCVGEFMKHLKEKGLDENTIVIFTSDNGPVGDDGYMDGAEVLVGDHKPAGPYRSGKYSLYEGGCRIPFILRWKNNVKPQVSDAMVCQMDFLASFASLLNIKTEVKDSKNILDAFFGKSKVGRTELIVQGLKDIAYRNTKWSLILPHKGPKMVPWGVTNETGFDLETQLFDLDADPGQKNNIAKDNPKIVEELTKKFKSLTDH